MRMDQTNFLSSVKRITGFGVVTVLCLSGVHNVKAGQVKADVKVIIDKLPIDDQDKMRNFHEVVKRYIDNNTWLEDDSRPPINVTIQMFLTDIPSNIEDRYKCEFLISGSDVQYYDKRVRFAYMPGDPLIYHHQDFEPLTGIIDFYVNMILGNELDKYDSFGGDVYYKRALNVASLGKFSRTEFILGWTEREDLIKRVFREPFVSFRKMKDFFFYGLFIKDEDRKEARSYLKQSLQLFETVREKISKANEKNMDEPGQFMEAHYIDFVNLFKDAENKNEIFEKLKALDPDHKELYEEHITKL